MEIGEFWSIVEGARADAADVAVGPAAEPEDTLASALVDRLAGMSKRDVFEYEQRFDQLHGALYRWDLWAAAYLIGGGCSDDAFMDFRAGLIAQGRAWYERAAQCPDVLAEHPDVIASAAEGRDEALFNELVNYAAANAHRRIVGYDDNRFYDEYADFLGPQPVSGPGDMGEVFDFDDHVEMRARLPRLARLFLGPVAD